jgi:hypothetical protein
MGLLCRVCTHTLLFYSFPPSCPGQVKRTMSSAAASRSASRVELEALKAQDPFLTLELVEDASFVFDGALAR